MSEKITVASPSRDENYIVKQNITNKFNEMIRETLEKQKQVLLKRKKDLETWQAKE